MPPFLRDLARVCVAGEQHDATTVGITGDLRRTPPAAVASGRDVSEAQAPARGLSAPRAEASGWLVSLPLHALIGPRAQTRGRSDFQLPISNCQLSIVDCRIGVDSPSCRSLPWKGRFVARSLRAFVPPYY